MLRSRVIGTCLLFLLFATGCGMPPEFQIRKGQNPEYQDDQVRFRTTYYFRVFDQCLPKDLSETAVKPRIDSIFRFTLTGKANALFGKVHFESGTLRASQIDPYGTRLESAEEIQSGEKCCANQVAAAEKPTVNPPKAAQPNGSPAKPDEISNQSAALPGHQDKICDDSTASRQGFQLWGPQGWRNFDPDERLIMAMSASAEPLIAQLEETARLQASARSSGFEVDVLLSQQDNRNRAARLAFRSCDVNNLAACMQRVISAYQLGSTDEPGAAQ